MLGKLAVTPGKFVVCTALHKRAGATDEACGSLSLVV